MVAVSLALMAVSIAWWAARSLAREFWSAVASVVKIAVACSTWAGLRESSVVYR